MIWTNGYRALNTLVTACTDITSPDNRTHSNPMICTGFLERSSPVPGISPNVRDGSVMSACGDWDGLEYVTGAKPVDA